MLSHKLASASLRAEYASPARPLTLRNRFAAVRTESDDAHTAGQYIIIHLNITPLLKKTCTKPALDTDFLEFGRKKHELQFFIHCDALYDLSGPKGPACGRFTYPDPIRACTYERPNPRGPNFAETCARGAAGLGGQGRRDSYLPPGQSDNAAAPGYW